MADTRFSAAELTGQSRSHVVDLDDPRCSLHREVVLPFLALHMAALGDGIDLRLASSFRDFGRQLVIWNGKFRGERELRGADGGLLDAAALSPGDLVEAILTWSALPGASRHHWGTDFDVYDFAAVPPDYVLQLSQEEFAPGGVFGRLNQWLDAHAGDYGFFRPYAGFRGGVRPEPWHLSHAEVAEAALGQFRVEMLEQALEGAGLDGYDSVRPRLPEIFARYVCNIDRPVSSPGTRLA